MQGYRRILRDGFLCCPCAVPDEGANFLSTVLTEKTIRAALASGVSRRQVLWDGGIAGLGLKLFPSGSASWVYVFRAKSAKRGTASSTLTLGSWPSVGINDARIAAKIHAGKIAQGVDPAAELRKQRLQPRRVLSHALDEFEKSLKRRRIVNVKTVMSALRRGLSPWLAREVETLTRAMIVQQVEALETAGKPGAAADLRKAARTFLEWCVTKDLIAFNPLAGLRRPRVSRADRLDGEARSGKALDDDQIKAVWAAAGNIGAFGGLVRLGLLTGMRRGELAGLKWSDVTKDRIVLHAHGTKTGVRHEVPLTPLMRNVLQAQAKTTSALLFPSPRRKASAQLSGWTQLVRTLVNASGVHFTLHDLRRSTRTMMSRLDVDQDIAELSIGHVRTGLVAIYNKDEVWAKRAEAFARVSDHVSALVAGGSGDTIPMPRKAS